MEKEIAMKLCLIQQVLNVPKTLKNTFGNYSYRSAEGILEALKKPLGENKCALIMSDDVVLFNSERYIKASATLIDAETGQTVTSTALAREANEKKGMDVSQVTGATSSYARKYALNALFAIDDNKDFDTDEAQRVINGGAKKEYAPKQPNSGAIAEAEKRVRSAKSVKELYAIFGSLSEEIKANKDLKALCGTLKTGLPAE